VYFYQSGKKGGRGAMSYYYLEVTRGTEVGRRYPLPDGAVSLGRSSQNTIVLHPSEKGVSGHHMIVYKSPERIMVQDLQSTNGTYVNEAKITEKEISTGDELGFGKSGPRLKLVCSEFELDLSPPTSENIIDTGLVTHEDMISPFLKKAAREARRKESRDSRDLNVPQETMDGSDDTRRTSFTMEVEQKLVGKKLDAGDLQKLMKDGKRLERVLERGSLGHTQTDMLRTMYSANRSTRHKWLYVVGGILVVSAAVTAFFIVRTFQYQKLMEKAQTIRKDLDEYDNRIASAHNNPEANKDDLERLVLEMETKEKSLSSLQSRIDQDDFGKFYSDPLERTIDEILMRFGESDYHIPKEMVKRVKHHIGVYSGSLREVIGRYIKRKDKYFPMIQRTFRGKNLPVELAYVSMLESGFNPLALSAAGARGLWQFMPATARQFGLKLEDGVDERTDPVKATSAAAEYFKDLIGIFGGKSSVMLCMAAYNAGEGRIMGALRKIDDPMRNRDFWYIYRMGYLAEETNEYIPRVIALMIISENPRKFGFDIGPAETASLENADDFVDLRRLDNK
jgi:pSer/pThr/pTyr-binding forkhead associated (FHA) protein